MIKLTNRDVVNKILEYHPKIENYSGCDCFKSGHEDDICTGVAVCLDPSMNAIKRAVEAGCNLVVTHETLFYQTPDYKIWKGDYKNKIFSEKDEYIKKHRIAVFRDHDHMHFHQPDCIFTGVMKELGWGKYYEKPVERDFSYIFDFGFEGFVYSDIIELFKEKINFNGIKYLGDKNMKIHKAAIVGHMCPNCFYPDHEEKDGTYHDYSMDIIKLMEENGVDLIIPGETIDWTVPAYIRDANELGHPKALMNIGHYNMEELGMKDFAKVIQKLVCSDLKVEYLQSKDSFNYINFRK